MKKIKKIGVQILLMGNKAAVVTMNGTCLKVFKVSVNYQKEIASFLRNGNFVISESTAVNFPYLNCFTS